jgi:hypothetical protein
MFTKIITEQYTATAAEESTISLPDLAGYEPVLVIQEITPLLSSEYTLNSVGNLALLAPLTIGQTITVVAMKNEDTTK